MVMVACGWRHTISVSSSGALYTYGWSKYGQLGHGDFEDHLSPHKLEALRDSFISQVIFFSFQHNLVDLLSISHIKVTWDIILFLTKMHLYSRDNFYLLLVPYITGRRFWGIS